VRKWRASKRRFVESVAIATRCRHTISKQLTRVRNVSEKKLPVTMESVHHVEVRLSCHS